MNPPDIRGVDPALRRMNAMMIGLVVVLTTLRACQVARSQDGICGALQSFQAKALSVLKNR